MDSGPRDLRRPDRIRRPLGRHASCTGKTVWEHSPTRRKDWEITRLNRGGTIINSLRYRPPSLTRVPLYPWALQLPSLPATWRPTRAPTWTRMVAWPPAACPRPVRHLRPARATRGSATWPQRRVAPTRWSRAPRVSSPAPPLATSSPAGKYPFLRFFNKKYLIKIK